MSWSVLVLVFVFVLVFVLVVVVVVDVVVVVVILVVVIVEIVLYCVCLFLSTFPIVLQLYVRTPPPPQHVACYHPPSHTAPDRQVAYTDVLSQATVPPQAHPSCVKRLYKKTAQPIIFHPRAGGPGRIRASDLEEPYQNCLVVQRAAKHPFVSPYLPPRARFSPPYVSTPLPHTPSNSHFVRKVKLRLAYRLAFVKTIIILRLTTKIVHFGGWAEEAMFSMYFGGFRALFSDCILV